MVDKIEYRIKIMDVEKYNPEWHKEFEHESKSIREYLGSIVIDIQHSGSIAIKGIASKPIVDIAVLVSNIENADAIESTLSNLGYTYFPKSSSVERMFFRKGNPVKCHLSLTEQGKTPYWERQILFRDYLNAHPEKAKEYENLKRELILKDPQAGQVYTDGKSEFVEEILKLAK